MFNAVKMLFASRKFLVALVTFIVSVLVTLFPALEEHTETLITAFTVIAGVLIGGIAYEDGQEKANQGVLEVEIDTTEIEGQG